MSAESGSDWQAVAAAVRTRMTALEITTPRLAQRASLSEDTIRGVLRGKGERRTWTLDVLSTGLYWPKGYLRDVAAGKAYLPHGLTIGEVVARIDARLAHVESKLDKLLARTARRA